MGFHRILKISRRGPNSLTFCFDHRVHGYTRVVFVIDLVEGRLPRRGNR